MSLTACGGSGRPAAEFGPSDWASCFDPLVFVAVSAAPARIIPIPGLPDVLIKVPKGTEITAGSLTQGPDGSIQIPARLAAEIAPGKFKLSEGALQVSQGAARYYLAAEHVEEIEIVSAPDLRMNIVFLDPAKAEATADKRIVLSAEAIVALTNLEKRSHHVKVPPVRPLFLNSKEKPVARYGTFNPLGVRIEIPRPAKLDAQAIVACVWRHDAKRDDGRRAAIAAATLGQTGPGIIEIVLPDGALSFWSPSWSQTVSVALVALDGSYAGLAHLDYVTPGSALVIATGLTAILVGAIGFFLRKEKGTANFVTSLFIGQDGTASISLMQMALWTIVAVWALIYVFLRTWTLLSMTSEVMALLGFAGVATVGARLIATSRNPVEIKGGVVTAVSRNANNFKLYQLFYTGEQFDLVKLQLFVFTALIATYVVIRVLRDGQFPQLDPNFLLLMGISNGVYLANKFVGPSAFTKAEGLKKEADILKERNDNLESKISENEKTKERLTREKQTAGPARVAEIDAEINRIDKDLAADKPQLATLKTEREDKLKAYQKALEELAK